MKKVIVCLSCICLTYVSAHAQGWHGIVPLHTSREDVQKILGPLKPGERSYDIGNQTALIFYAEGGCDAAGNKKWNVSPGTVEEIVVSPKKNLPPAELGLEQKNFEKDALNLRGDLMFTNLEAGISFITSNENLVTQIFYYPALKDKNLICPAYAAKLLKEDKARQRYLSSLEGKEETRPYRLFDEYGELPFADEKKRLDNFAFTLNEYPTINGYIIVYPQLPGSTEEARTRAESAKKYLVEKGIDSSRIIIIEGGVRERFTIELYFVPCEAPAPTPSPSISPKDIKG